MARAKPRPKLARGAPERRKSRFMGDSNIYMPAWKSCLLPRHCVSKEMHVSIVALETMCQKNMTWYAKKAMIRRLSPQLRRFGASIMRHACSKNNFGLQNDLGTASEHQDTIPDEIYMEIGDVRRPQKYIQGNYEAATGPSWLPRSGSRSGRSSQHSAPETAFCWKC